MRQRERQSQRERERDGEGAGEGEGEGEKEREREDTHLAPLAASGPLVVHGKCYSCTCTYKHVVP